MNAFARLEAETELGCVRLGLSWSLAAIAQPAAAADLAILLAALTHATTFDTTRTARALALVAHANQHLDGLDLAASACAAVAVLVPFDC